MREPNRKKSPEGALYEICGADFVLTIVFEWIKIIK